MKERFAQELAGEPPGQGRHARALLRLMMSNRGPFFERLRRVAAPLLASMSSNPKLLDPMRAFFNGVRQGMLADGLAADTAWLVLAALDGLKFWKIFGLLEPAEADLAQLRNRLARIIDQG